MMVPIHEDRQHIIALLFVYISGFEYLYEFIVRFLQWGTNISFRAGIHVKLITI